jgi:hypothetical protein
MGKKPQEEEGITFNEVIIDSTTMKAHRQRREEPCRAKREVSCGDNRRWEACRGIITRRRSA